jgi:hypothetical protein
MTTSSKPAKPSGSKAKSPMRLDLGSRTPPAPAQASADELQKRLAGAQGWTQNAATAAAGGSPSNPAPAQDSAAAGEAAERPAFPWLDANPAIKKGYSLRVPEPMLKKLEFLKQNEPNVSVHKLILQGIAKELDARLPKFGWDGNNLET